MKKTIKRISVIGLGYIGLPTATMFASHGVEVIGVDVNRHVVDTINAGNIHIVEPELDVAVRAAVMDGKLRATTRAEAADAFLIAVPTPVRDGHRADLSFVAQAAHSIAGVLKKGDTVILESTSPVGTTEQLVEWLAFARPDLIFPGEDGSDPDVHVAYCPERVLLGQVVRELVRNDRIIGGMTRACARKAADIYRVFVEGQLFFTDARTAEMSKLTENAFRDVNIAFANELSLICDKLGINVWELIRLANRHPRVNILQPGCGVGGHCIAVDPWFIVESTPEESRLIRTAREINDYKPLWVLANLQRAVALLVASGRKESSLTVAILGLAFKPNIDDLRESPALEIAELFAAETKARLLFAEPNIPVLPAALAEHSLVSAEEAVAQADVVVLLVNHREFAGIRERLGRRAYVVDPIGLSLPEEQTENDCTPHSIHSIAAHATAGASL